MTSNHHQHDQHHQPLREAVHQERQLTFRAVAAGCLLGSVMSAINIYFGLHTGWTVGGSIMTAIIAFSFFRYLCQSHDYSILENNITQTAGSGAGFMSAGMGLVSVIPALQLMGTELPMSTIYLWGFSVATLGVFYAIPFRQQFIIKEKLRFPTGIATAETILAMHEADHQDKRASVLFRFAIIAAVFTLTAFFLPFLESLPVFTWLGFATATTWGFSLYMSPMLIGGGMLVGPRVGISLGLGALLAWALLGPLAQHYGWVTGPIFDYRTGIQGWVLWPGVSLMVADSLVTFVLSLKKLQVFQFIRKFHWSRQAPSLGQVPNAWWICGLGITSVFTIISMQVFFDIPAFLTLIAIVLSWLLAAIATRATGETDINPASAVSKLTQLAYGGLAPGQAVTNLMAAGVSNAGAAMCADMMQDLKTGYLLGATPRKQFIAQLFGCVSGIVFSVPIYELFNRAYDIGGKTLPAPSAHAWRAMSELLTKGVSALPEHALLAVIIAGVVGVVLALARYYADKPWLPSGVAVGIAFIIPAYYSLDFFIGAMLLLLWRRVDARQSRQLAFAVASGLLVGEGLMGIAKAGMTLLGVQPLFE